MQQAIGDERLLQQPDISHCKKECLAWLRNCSSVEMALSGSGGCAAVRAQLAAGGLAPPDAGCSVPKAGCGDPNAPAGDGAPKAGGCCGAKPLLLGRMPLGCLWLLCNGCLLRPLRPLLLSQRGCGRGVACRQDAAHQEAQQRL